MAVTLTAEQLAARVRGAAVDKAGTLTEWGRSQYEAAKARVEREAPGAPDAVADEALTRFAGYLTQSDFGGVRSEQIEPWRVEYVTTHSNAWRNSGAAGLLAPWKVRRAGVIA